MFHDNHNSFYIIIITQVKGFPWDYHRTMTNTSKSFALIASLLLVSPYVDAGKVIRGRFDRNKKNTQNKQPVQNSTIVEVPTAVRAPRAIPNFAMAEMTPEEIAEGIASRTWAAQCINR
jgi:hypothetical protein